MKFTLERPEQLSAIQRAAYHQLFYTKAARKALEGRHPLGMKREFELFLLGAYENEVLVGCILLSIYKSLRGADLHYISVIPEERGKGIAKKLLIQLKEVLTSRKLNFCWAKYLQEDPCAPILEYLFSSLGWGAPYRELVRYIFEGVLFNPPWLGKNYSLPAGCEDFLWADITDEERSKLRHQQFQNTFPRSVSPLSTKYAIEPTNSLGIRKDGEIVGWLITHRLNKETVRYSVFYLDRDIRMSQCAVYLLSKSISIQKGTGIPWAVCEINFNNVSPAWRRLVRNKLEPYANRIENEMVSTLSLVVL